MCEDKPLLDSLPSSIIQPCLLVPIWLPSCRHRETWCLKSLVALPVKSGVTVHHFASPDADTSSGTARETSDKFCECRLACCAVAAGVGVSPKPALLPAQCCTNDRPATGTGTGQAAPPTRLKCRHRHRPLPSPALCPLRRSPVLQQQRRGRGSRHKTTTSERVLLFLLVDPFPIHIQRQTHTHPHTHYSTSWPSNPSRRSTRPTRSIRPSSSSMPSWCVVCTLATGAAKSQH